MEETDSNDIDNECNYTVSIYWVNLHVEDGEVIHAPTPTERPQ